MPVYRTDIGFACSAAPRPIQPQPPLNLRLGISPEGMFLLRINKGHRKGIHLRSHRPLIHHREGISHHQDQVGISQAEVVFNVRLNQPVLLLWRW